MQKEEITTLAILKFNIARSKMERNSFGFFSVMYVTEITSANTKVSGSNSFLYYLSHCILVL